MMEQDQLAVGQSDRIVGSIQRDAEDVIVRRLAGAGQLGGVF